MSADNELESYFERNCLCGRFISEKKRGCRRGASCIAATPESGSMSEAQAEVQPVVVVKQPKPGIARRLAGLLWKLLVFILKGLFRLVVFLAKLAWRLLKDRRKPPVAEPAKLLIPEDDEEGPANQDFVERIKRFEIEKPSPSRRAEAGIAAAGAPMRERSAAGAF